MTAAQLCGGKLSAAFANTRRRWSKAAGSSSVGQSCRFSYSLPLAIRKSCEDVSGICNLSADRRKLPHKSFIHCRKPFHNVTRSLLDSDCTIEPCDVEEDSHDLVESAAEESTLEKNNGVNGSRFEMMKLHLF